MGISFISMLSASLKCSRILKDIRQRSPRGVQFTGSKSELTKFQLICATGLARAVGAVEICFDISKLEDSCKTVAGSHPALPSAMSLTTIDSSLSTAASRSSLTMVASKLPGVWP